ncbi:bifunctional serine/threonine-protein kinase/formylglycine-generating enzyme family protein [Myxococcota bacterium]|nr:bifunctional serine/threonine-protein kinase/formylglycine-generating enzyme family protein [Myxococcota bacterium]
MSEQQKLTLSRGTEVAGKYEIEKDLGEGLLGRTYLAKHLKSGKHLALKFLRPRLLASAQDRKRLEDAFTLVKPLRHEGLVRYGDLGEHQGLVFFSQEYFPGQSLRALIEEYQREQRSFGLQEACQIVNSILLATQYLHDQNIVHRNLKPENILVRTRRTGPGGKNAVHEVRITDAGLAALINPTIFAESFVSREEAPYLAPELAGFDQDGTPPSDIYSIGVILYELLVGQTPRGTYLSPTQLRGDLPEHIDDIVEIALGPNPEDRYPSAKDMLADIQRSFSGELVTETSGTSFKNVIIGLGVAVGMAGTFALYLQVREQPDPLAGAKAADQAVRAQVQANLRMPSEAELQLMVSAHPDMLYIPPGPFVMGRLNQEDVEIHASQSEPLAQVVKTDGYFIDRFEFPNRTKDKDGNPVKPVAKVSWVQADETCRTQGKRLCTEEEWERACKGPGNWVFSYADTYDPEMCGAGVEDPYNVGDRSTCVSGYGVAMLSGGLREWTATVAGSKGNRRVVKGGLRGNPQRGSRCAFAVDESATYADTTLGFRCCLDVSTPGSAEPAPAPGTPAPE